MSLIFGPMNSARGALSKRSEWVQKWNVRQVTIQTTADGSISLGWQGGANPGVVRCDEWYLQGSAEQLVVRTGERRLYFRAAPRGPQLDEWAAAFAAACSYQSALPGSERRDDGAAVASTRSDANSCAPPAAHDAEAEARRSPPPRVQTAEGALASVGGGERGGGGSGDAEGYEGEYNEQGAYDGRGTFRFGSGDVYVGEWRAGRRQAPHRIRTR
jgi:hypothetical protein